VDKTHYDVVIIGAGHAGLSTSYFLQQRGIDHVVLEQAQVADSWRNQRWDTFTLVTPGWMNHLPGFRHPRGDNDFLPKDAVIAYLESYARSFALPVQEGRRVSAVREAVGGGFRVELADDYLSSRAVVVATGAMRHPKIPSWTEKVPCDVMQIHSSEYRHPGQLAPGGVLVVGSGQSGCQIAEEALEAGKTIYLSVGKCGRIPRRYRGDDCLAWLARMGVYDRTVDMVQTEAELSACNPYVSGKNGGHEINLRVLAAQGLRLLGRCEGTQDHQLTIADDLEDNLTQADRFAATVRTSIDQFIERQKIVAPIDPPEPETNHAVIKSPRTLPWVDTKIGTVIWATGFQNNFPEIALPVFDTADRPIHRRGKTDSQGLYFIGLPWLYKLKSSLIFGIQEDAAYIAEDICALLTT